MRETPRLNGSEKHVSTDAYLRALNLLTRRDHTVAELKQKLAQRGFSAHAIGAALEKLTDQGFLDDRRFAEKWTAAALNSGRGYGLRLMQELQRKGVSRDIAMTAVAAASAEQSETELLAAIVARRFALFDPAVAPLKEKQRIYSYLQRRGFSLQVITGFFMNQDRGV